MRPYVLLAAALVLGGCSGGDEGARPAPTPSSTQEPTVTVAAPPPPPRPDRCYRLRYRDALATTTDRPRVPCRRRHTSVTSHVGRLDLSPGGRQLAVDHPRVQRQAAETCADRLAPHLGGTPELVRRTMLASVWFTPTAEEAAAGARWFRCDVVALGPERSLLPLPPSTRGVLADAQGRERFAMCGTTSPDDDAFRRVTCSSDHTWRAVATVGLPGRAYPTPQEMASRMEGPCREAAREAAADPLDFRWTEERPTRQQWRAGQHHGICWAPD